MTTSGPKYVVIGNGKNRSGFFSLVLRVLRILGRCDQEGLVPVVHFDRDCVFWSNDGYCGAMNPWEYYFEPVSSTGLAKLLGVEPNALHDKRIEEIYVSRSDVIVSNDWPELRCPDSVNADTYLRDLFCRHVRIRPAIQDEVDKYVRTHFSGRKIVGVHLRGQEKEVETGRFHKKGFLEPYFYMLEVDRYLRDAPDAKLFLATDSVWIRDWFIKKYGNRVLSRAQVLSSNADLGPHKTVGGPRAGAEVLVDSMLLARSSFFVHGISNVSRAVYWLNPGIDGRNVYDIYRRSAQWIWRVTSSRVYNERGVSASLRSAFHRCRLGRAIHRVLWLLGRE